MGLMVACTHYSKSDLPMFLAGYEELCRVNLNGRKALEVCCGHGELTRQLGRVFPQAELFAMERLAGGGIAIEEAQKREGVANLRYIQGDVMQLSRFEDESLDLVFGQGTLHHLGHDVWGVAREFSRVLKRGGRLVFISEPLGHNAVFAMIRAYRTARQGMVDESNVFISQLDNIAASFCKSEIQVFNLLGYPCKGLGRFANASFMEWIDRLDVALMRRSERLACMAANFNVVFTK
jgi:SAM-dependent methyltransferase